MKGIFSVLVENKDGVLSQISGLFARRGFNIDSLAVGNSQKSFRKLPEESTKMNNPPELRTGTALQRRL